MKKNKFIETITGKSNEDLKKMVAEKKEKIRSLKFDLIAGKVKNVKEIKNVKKEISRILTLINSVK